MIEITQDNFDEFIAKKGIVLFSSSSCGPCHLQKNIIEKNEYTMEVEFGRVNCDNNPLLANQNNIQALPTTILFSEKKEINRKVGVQNIDSLKGMLI